MRIKISTHFNRHSSALPRRPFRTPAGLGFLRSRSLAYRAQLRERRAPVPPDAELQRELQKVRELVTDLNARLESSQDRVDASLQRIGLTLEDLSSQREQIQSLERDLGIER